MAALGSALGSQLRAAAPARANKPRSVARRGVVSTVTRAASTENKIENVAAAVDPALLLPQGEYCEYNYKTNRRPTR